LVFLSVFSVICLGLATVSAYTGVDGFSEQISLVETVYANIHAYEKLGIQLYDFPR
jgi:hypothetical protein